MKKKHNSLYLELFNGLILFLTILIFFNNIMNFKEEIMNNSFEIIFFIGFGYIISRSINSFLFNKFLENFKSLFIIFNFIIISIIGSLIFIRSYNFFYLILNLITLYMILSLIELDYNLNHKLFISRFFNWLIIKPKSEIDINEEDYEEKEIINKKNNISANNPNYKKINNNNIKEPNYFKRGFMITIGVLTAIFVFILILMLIFGIGFIALLNQLLF